MFGINALRNAVATLAANVLGLAGTVAEVNAHVRQRAGLDAPDPAEALTLTMPAEASGVAQDATAAADAQTADSTAPASRNGRRRTAAATAGE